MYQPLIKFHPYPAIITQVLRIFVSVKIAIERPTAGQYKQIRSFPVFVTKNVTKEISV